MSSIPSRVRGGLRDTLASAREFLAECKAESEAVRVAVDEVRYPSSDKVIRIY